MSDLIRSIANLPAEIAEQIIDKLDLADLDPIIKSGDDILYALALRRINNIFKDENAYPLSYGQLYNLSFRPYLAKYLSEYIQRRKLLTRYKIRSFHGYEPILLQDELQNYTSNHTISEFAVLTVEDFQHQHYYPNGELLFWTSDIVRNLFVNISTLINSGLNLDLSGRWDLTDENYEQASRLSQNFRPRFFLENYASEDFIEKHQSLQSLPDFKLYISKNINLRPEFQLQYIQFPSHIQVIGAGDGYAADNTVRSILNNWLTIFPIEFIYQHPDWPWEMTNPVILTNPFITIEWILQNWRSYRSDLHRIAENPRFNLKQIIGIFEEIIKDGYQNIVDIKKYNINPNLSVKDIQEYYDSQTKKLIVPIPGRNNPSEVNVNTVMSNRFENHPYSRFVINRINRINHLMHTA